MRFNRSMEMAERDAAQTSRPGLRLAQAFRLHRQLRARAAVDRHHLHPRLRAQRRGGRPDRPARADAERLARVQGRAFAAGDQEGDELPPRRGRRLRDRDPLRPRGQRPCAPVRGRLPPLLHRPRRGSPPPHLEAGRRSPDDHGRDRRLPADRHVLRLRLPAGRNGPGRPILRQPRATGTMAQDLFFSFTTMLTIGFGNLVPVRNPGQTMAVAEGLTGQLFLVVAVAKVVSAWKPAAARPRPTMTTALLRRRLARSRPSRRRRRSRRRAAAGGDERSASIRSG